MGNCDESAVIIQHFNHTLSSVDRLLSKSIGTTGTTRLPNVLSIRWHKCICYGSIILLNNAAKPAGHVSWQSVACGSARQTQTADVCLAFTTAPHVYKRQLTYGAARRLRQAAKREQNLQEGDNSVQFDVHCLATRARRVHIIRWLVTVACTSDAPYRSPWVRSLRCAVRDSPAHRSPFPRFSLTNSPAGLPAAAGHVAQQAH